LVFLGIKIYDFLDWVILSLPYTQVFIAITNGIYLGSIIVLLIITIDIAIKTKISFLRIKMVSLFVALSALFIELIFISSLEITIFDLRLVAGAFLIWPMTIFSSYAVSYKVKDFTTLLGLESNTTIKLNKSDERITALLWKYTSKENTCEYYDPNINSKCKLDPNSYRLFNCKGIKYTQGNICTYIYSKEKIKPY
jgi:hypothetical protein